MGIKKWDTHPTLVFSTSPKQSKTKLSMGGGYLESRQSKTKLFWEALWWGQGRQQSPSIVNDSWGAHSILKDCMEQDNYVTPRKTWRAGVPPPCFGQIWGARLVLCSRTAYYVTWFLIGPAKYQQFIIFLPPFLERGRPSFPGSPWLFLFLWTMNCLSLLSKENKI